MPLKCTFNDRGGNGSQIGYKEWFLIELIKRPMQIDTLPRPQLGKEDATNIDRDKLDLKGMVDWTDTALEHLEEVYEECSEPNWDGYEAEPISYETYLEARKLLTMIPSSLPMPEILAEPDGEVGLEWYTNRYSVFVVSVAGRNIITYAGLFGKSNKVHGTEFFTDELPPNIVSNIRRVVA